MREVERSAASVEEAVEAALAELGIHEQEARVEIVQEPQKGLLGIGGQKAVVRVRAVDAEPDEADLEEQVEAAEDFLDGFLDLLDMDSDLESGLVDGVMYVDVVGGSDPDALGLLIGRHGQTLDALQDVVRSAVQRRTGSRSRIMVDVEDYRKRRRAQLADRARGVAARVRRTGKPERMEPMNAFERKVVHDAAARAGGVETSSEGEEPQRRVVIRKR